MIEPSNALASIVRQSGPQEFADAITIDQPATCNREVHSPAGCYELAVINARQHVVADIAAIGFALFAAAVVGRIAVTFVALFGTCLEYHRARAQVRASAKLHASHGGLVDG
ncbi:hypothetical protein [Novosphingobium sp. HII-3]|uniref:hypothetical protein n=1 Tax=Novosphingobium sp. HII-3 TaxID=2075565 RepID=UPI000CDAA7B0|nr:hypothetical protein [Novosphingobium sp. HII-3]